MITEEGIFLDGQRDGAEGAAGKWGCGITPEQVMEVDRLYAELAAEVGRYRKLGTLEEVRAAVGKQRARKPHPCIAFGVVERDGCPNCFGNGGRNVILYAGQKYCSVCGQAISWEAAPNRKNDAKGV